MKVEGAADQKLRGGFYTPEKIAEFICKWAVRSKTESVFEPSCGDGNIIVSAVKRLLELGVKKEKLGNFVQGVELIESEAQAAQVRLEALGMTTKRIVNADFFSFIEPNYGIQKYDVIVGNPPFIRYQNFPEEHREIAFRLMTEAGLSPNKLTNIWVPFLVVAATSLRPNGRLAMVIPAELFQVKYAAETRIFLSNYFQRITIVTFRKLVFPGIQQEVVLLLCEKTVGTQGGIRVVEVDDEQSLTELNLDDEIQNPVKVLEHDSEKWTKYFLENSDIQLLREVKQGKEIKSCKEYMDVEVGLVTGCNDFFMLNSETVRNRKLANSVMKVVSRSAQLRGIQISNVDFEAISNEQLRCYMFLPRNAEKAELSKSVQAYIAEGEEAGYHTGYKCRIRKRWYITPSLWQPDAFVLRQVGEYPKIVINQAEACSTDTIHRVRLKPGIDAQIIAVSFLNSLSFAFSEILGRSYGGGVLTFEPSEVEEIPLPLLDRMRVNFNQIDQLIREKRIEDVLDIVDQALLVEQYGFTIAQVGRFRSIWQKMSRRRHSRGK